MLTRESMTERRMRWRAWSWSFLLHSSLCFVLVARALWIPLPALAPRAAQWMIAPDAQDSEPLTIVAHVEPAESWMAQQVDEVTFPEVDLSDARWTDILAEPEQRLSDNQRRGGSQLIDEQLQQWIDRTRDRSQGENLADLAQLGDRLTNVSSATGVDEVSGTLSRLLGTKERAAQPQDQIPAGPFDHNTAQVHDVKVIEQPDGTKKYIAIMIDAAGRTMEVEMDPAAGEQAHRTMQLVKSNPLLERVYRGVVMGLIDKMLQSQK